TENQAYNGASQQGYFYLVVNDGTGSPPSTLLTTISNAVDACRPVGTSFGVFAPVVVDVAIVMTVTVASGYSHATVAAAIQAALQAYINALPIGGTLPYTLVATTAYQTSPGVTNVTGVTVNGATADLIATNQQVFQYTSATIN
ncbi:MAG: baseplate J/gp47 family protein, partial [Steroidobacteraceae bacterium]